MTPILCGCEIECVLREGTSTRVLRGRRLRDDAPVVLKVLLEHDHGRAAAFRHEHGILRMLADVEGVVRALDLGEHEGQPVLILEDIGAAALSEGERGEALSLPDFLGTAIALTEIVGAIHQRRVLHKDLNPTNVVMRASDRRLQVIDFGISTVLSEETAGFQSAARVEGTLAYMSPEQTGRMNRSIDYRTDYYSLGVTLFELLTGRRPFISDDALDLLHRHIAQRPPSPREIRPEVPEPVAAIVQKLLAKSAEDRYQSAAGLRADLETCLADLRRRGTIEPFPLGRRDTSERFRLPQRLYGRGAEAAALLAAFDRSLDGARLMMVRGTSGIGKSALIQELYRPISERRGYFAAGKFDQFQRHVPYAALVQALEALVHQVLTEPPARVAAWAEAVRAALPTTAQVLVEACPDLQLILGPQPSVPPASPADARTRFNLVVRDFFAAVATPERPLCLFLDDLQWADADTLKLLAELSRGSARSSLFLLGAYRGNEVGEAHPLALTLEEIRKQGGHVETLDLGPLALADVTALTADTLGVPPAEAAPLAELLLARTAGNPFFARAFLTSLHAGGLITAGAAGEPSGWRWDLDRIRGRGVTDNVVDLIVDRIQRLPRAAQASLEIAACLGAAFDLGTVARVADRPAPEVAADLWEAVEATLLIPLDRVHSAVEMQSGDPSLRCAFAHDRIQQAVLTPLGDEDRARLHLRVGRRLLAALPEGDRERPLYDAVGQLDQGRAAMTSRGELDGFAALALEAAGNAVRRAASQQALAYAEGGLAALGEGGWERLPERARALHGVAAEAAFLAGDHAAVRRHVAAVVAHAGAPLDELRVRMVEGRLLAAEQRLVEATQVFVQLLGRIGFPIPEEPTPEQIGAQMGATAAAIGDRSIEDLLDLPRCEDRAAGVAIEILSQMITTVGPSLKNLFSVVPARMVELSILHGNAPASSFGYTFYGVLLTFGGDLARADRFGRMALALAHRFGDKGYLGLVELYTHYQLIHWTTPLAEISPHLLDAYRYAAESGIPFAASCAAATLCINRFLAGDELRELRRDMARYGEVVVRYRQEVVTNWHQIYQQAVTNLVEDVADPLLFAGPFYVEAERVPQHLAASDAAAMFNYTFCKAYLCYVHGDHAGAAAQADAHAPFHWAGATALWASTWAYLESLIRLAVHDAQDAEGKAEILAAVEANLGMLAAWRPLCPRSVDHKIHTIEAERHRILGRDAEARASFERAVETSRQGGITPEEAIAAELSARFHTARRDVKLARYLMRDAHQLWLRWGAVNKARKLEREFPHFLPRVAGTSLGAATITLTSSAEADFNVLDLISVLDASQAMSREIELGKVLDRLMHLVIEAGGAQSGWLLLEQEGAWIVEAERSFDQEAARLDAAPLDDLAARGRAALPASVLRYVSRTREPLVLDDASASPQFAVDPVIAARGVRSLLCLPLPRQVGSPGLLYLENNLLQGAFTPGRIRILELLSTQAAISIENATLYATLEQKVAARTREISAKNEELAATLQRLREAQDRMVVQDRLASLGSLAAGISHELLNPLNFVKNFNEASSGLIEEAAEIAEGSALAAPLGEVLGDLRDNLGKVGEHSRRMEGIIRSMREHARAESGEHQRTDLNAVVESYVNFAMSGQHARTAGPAIDVTYELDLDPRMAPIEVVPREISRVVLSLVENAADAVMAKRRLTAGAYAPTVRVSTRDLGDRVEIRVHDNGTGIPAKNRGMIMNPFFTTKKTGEGTGLGLSISHNIVVAGHGGDLRFQTEEGQFTEFVVSLPRR
jgi:predicted ATPase/signal transduction histidine kinase